jgi:LysR family transcriptional regulator for metE and metH
VERIALDVRDLQLVVALADSGSTVRAASTLHITQSAVSRGLLVAEEKLGTRLFDRTPKGLTPTAAGTTLLEGATSLLAQLAELEARVAGAEQNPLRLVCECYTAYRWLPSTVTRLELDVTLAVDHTKNPVDALLSDKIDVALLTTSSLPKNARFEERTLFADEIVFLVSDDHPLARRPKLELRDLSSYPLITSSQTPDLERKWFMERALGKKLPEFKIPSIRFPLTEAIIDAARAGMGIAVLSEWIASPYLEGKSRLIAKRLNGKPIARPWRIAYRKDRADTALRFAAAIEHVAPRVYQ